MYTPMDYCMTDNRLTSDLPATANQPTIATSSKLTGTSFMVIMVDLDIPSNSTPHTFLHWMQTNLAPSTAASAVTTANGTVQAFTLAVTNNTAAIVNYTQPSPPAQNPLSHRYTEVLVDTSSMSAAALNTLTTAAQSRVGFDVATVLQSAGLTANVVAGNSFNVTNAGPATNANANAAAAAASNSTASTTAKKGGKANATKGSKKTKTGAAAAAQATGGGNGNGKGKGSGNAHATKSGGNSASNTAAAGAAGLPAATGTTVSSNLTSAAGAKNGTGTVTVSGAMSGYGFIVPPVYAVLAGLLGVFAYAL